MKRWILISIHVALWMAVLILPQFFVNDQMRTSDFYIGWAITMFFNIALFYFYFLHFNPRYLNKKKILKYFIGTVLVVGAYSAFRVLIDVEIDKITEHADNRTFITRYWVMVMTCFFFLGIATFFNLVTFWFKNQQLKSEMEKQKLRSELDMLKYQVNPHFLFNTLNNIYTLVYKKSDKAPQAVLKLSHIMRYMIYETNCDKVPLEKEIDYLKYFIELQQLRLKEGHQINFTVNGESKDKTIVPMLLIPFVENAFKHGVGGSEQGEIKIEMDISDQKIIFRTINAISKKKINKDEYSGIGLQNVEKRLTLLYPGMHDLSISKENDKFQVELTILM